MRLQEPQRARQGLTHLLWSPLPTLLPSALNTPLGIFRWTDVEGGAALLAPSRVPGSLLLPPEPLQPQMNDSLGARELAERAQMGESRAVRY